MIKLELRKKTKDYIIPLSFVSQWCGSNVICKNTIIDDLAKYFSNTKYAEYEVDMSDNIMLDGERVGRKYYQLYFIDSRNTLLQMVKMSKNSLLLKHIHFQMEKFDYQHQLEIIDECLLKIYDAINVNLNEFIGGVVVDYERSELLDILQQSTFIAADGRKIDGLETEELIQIFLNTISEIQAEEPDNLLVIIKDIDHLVSKVGYRNVVMQMTEISRNSSIRFIVSTSLPGYVVVNEELYDGVSSFGDEMVSLPQFEYLKEYIENSYPCLKEWNNDDLLKALEESVLFMGSSFSFSSLDTLVISKLMNKTMLIDNYIKNITNPLLISFLNDKNVV